MTNSHPPLPRIRRLRPDSFGKYGPLFLRSLLVASQVLFAKSSDKLKFKRAPARSASKRLASLLLPLAFGAIALAAQANPLVTRLNTTAGLVGDSITAIAQDSRGIIWIGTESGLSRYDGYEFISFTSDSGDREGLSANGVRDLLVDESNRLWVATDRGLHLFSPGTSSFRRFGYSELAWSLNSSGITRLLLDSKKRIWIGTDRGLNRYIGDSKFISIETEPSELPSEIAVSSLMEDTNGGIWIGTSDGSLLKFDEDAAKLVQATRSSRQSAFSDIGSIDAILERDAEGLWLVTRYAGLLQFDRTDRSFRHLHASPGMESTWPGRVKVAAAASPGLLIVGTRDSIQTLGSDSAPRNLISIDTGLDIPHFTPTVLFQDKGGVLWIGTRGRGILKSSPPVNGAGSATQKPSMQAPPLDSNVRALAESGDNVVWLATDAGLSRWNPSSRDSIANALSMSPDRAIAALAISEPAELWVATENAGVFVAKTDLTGLTRVDLPPDEGRRAVDHRFACFFKDSEGNLWSGAAGGIYLHRPDKVATRYTLPDGVYDQTRPPRITDIAQDRRGVLWLAVEHSGIALLNPKSKRFHVLRDSTLSTLGLSSNDITALEGHRHVMFIGTRLEGLVRFDMETGTHERFALDGLGTHYSVQAIAVDEHGKPWISSDKGIFGLIDGESRTLQRFGPAQGVMDSIFNPGAALRTSGGLILFGGQNGLVYLDPGKLTPDRRAPSLAVTQVLSSKTNPLDLTTYSNPTETIFLPSGDAGIELRFAAMDFTAPQFNRFSYRLYNYDSNWSVPSASRTALYPQLPEGRYLFHLKGSNSDGTWNESGISVPIVVGRPSWEVAVSALVVLILAVLTFYLKRDTILARVSSLVTSRFGGDVQLYIDSLEEASDGVFITDSETRIVYANKASYALLGQLPEAIKGSRLITLLLESSNEPTRIDANLARDGRWQGELKLEVSGRGVLADLTIQRIQTRSQQNFSYIAIMRDMTERRRNESELEKYRARLEELVGQRTEALSREIVRHEAAQKELAASLREKELLLKEVHHRVKNNMQVISSLLHIQANTIQDARFSSLLEESQQRVKAMAMIHENLYLSEDLVQINFRNYVGMLTSSLMRLHKTSGAQVELVSNVDEIALDIDKAVPCGLIVNELVSNSLKHGVDGRDQRGLIEVRFSTFEDYFMLSIADNGAGVPPDFDFFNAQSMGMEIVQVLTEQLHGHVHMISDAGTEFRVYFPALFQEADSDSVPA